ncbi:aspartate aminotransferase family protein [Fusibacter ferrireducens]|uniref:alanine--glyoxylate transaminase n=1 Tax=Fusibacter ferrireducens TaxID=2785058 RepID=A0ABR9ZN71_9FIRM|nr:aspartate aminotransferase family protein [Fusibacter ferrireducens]MBF4691910.1 aspartate aminotransferase family protein [Fusibacter ferrireducens]
MLTSSDIIQLKKDYFFPNAMHFYKNPPHIVKGAGQFLYDDQGKCYRDFFAGVTVVNCGHCEPAITQKTTTQLQTLQHTSIIYLTEPMVLLAERLAKYLPGDIKNTFFCCSGTEANEGALLLARLHTGKRGFIAFEGGLHGRSALTMSVTGIPMWRIDPFLDPNVYFAKGFMGSEADIKAISNASLESVEHILKTNADEIAACIVEPIQGNGGINIPHRTFFKRLKTLLESYGVLLITDEVQTGFARTGKMFAIEHFDVVPDIITMAKALGNGVPVGAFSARPHIAKSFNKPSASTLGGNPVSMSTGLAVLDFIEDNKLCKQSEDLGNYLKEKLLQLKNEFKMIEDVRGLGLMVGMTLSSSEIVDQILEKMLQKGFIVGKNGMNRDVIALQPPLVIHKADIDLLIQAFKEAFTEL